MILHQIFVVHHILDFKLVIQDLLLSKLTCVFCELSSDPRAVKLVDALFKSLVETVLLKVIYQLFLIEHHSLQIRKV